MDGRASWDGRTAEPSRRPLRGPHLVVWTASGALELPLPAGDELVLGRGDECDVTIPDPSVSRRHARIRVRPTFTIEDLGSANGTRVGRAPCPAGRITALRYGESIGLGDAMVMLVAGEDRATDDAHAPVHRSAAMREVVRLVERIAPSDIDVLVWGPTGSGKQRLCEHLHAISPRGSGPFVTVDCAIVSGSLLESTLFGHVRGAFTGADRDRTGLLVEAHGGTVFLDGVDELPASTQTRLLRAVQEKEVRPLGGDSPITFDVRYVSATTRDLSELVAAGTFREDLYFRLAGATLRVPGLAERPEDVPLIVEELLADAARRHGLADVPRLEPDAIEALLVREWPGNVRELRNVLERTALFARTATIHARDLSLGELATDEVDAPLLLRDSVHEHIRRRVVAALEAASGNQTRAAKLLGIGRRTLIDHMERYGIDRPRAQSK